MNAAKRRLLACVLGPAAALAAVSLLLAVTASASPPGPGVPPDRVGPLTAITGLPADHAGGRAPDGPVLRIEFKKTVGIALQCSAITATSVVVAVGTAVRYCYTVYNTGSVTVTRHSLVDSEFLQLLIDYPYTLTPGNGAQFSRVFTPSASVVNTATWTAYNPGPTDVVSDTKTATVTVLVPYAYFPLVQK
jgi:hypothetical protein